MAWAWRHTLVMDRLQAGWQKKSHTHRRISGGVCGQGLSAELWSLFVDELIEGHRNGCYTLGYVPSSAENSQYCLTASEDFVYGTTVVKYNSNINPSTKGSVTGSISYETRSLRWKCKQDTELCSKCEAAKCKKI